MISADDIGQRCFDVGRVSSRNKKLEKNQEVTLEIYIAVHQLPLRVGMRYPLEVIGTFVQRVISGVLQKCHLPSSVCVTVYPSFLPP